MGVELNAVDYWMDELVGRSRETQKRYSHYFSAFCEFVNMTPNEILEQRKQDRKAPEIWDQRRMETLLKKFIAYLESEGFSTSTQQVAYAAVRSFFEQNYYPLMMRRGDYPRGDNIGHRAVTKKEIRRMLDEANVGQKAAIMMLKDSGLRVSDVIALKIGDLEPGLSDGARFIPLQLITKKNKVVARTFLGPEAIEAIKKYLDHRRKGTRCIPKEEITENSPLLRAQVSEEVRPLSRSGLSSTMTWLADRIGLNGDVSAHSLRKFFQTRMESTGVNPNWIDHMIGRKLQGVHGHYSYPTVDELLEKYRKTYLSLRVYEQSEAESIGTLQSQFQELKRENENLRMIVNDLSKRKTEIDKSMNLLLEDPDVQSFLLSKLKEHLRDGKLA